MQSNCQKSDWFCFGLQGLVIRYIVSHLVRLEPLIALYCDDYAALTQISSMRSDSNCSGSLDTHSNPKLSVGSIMVLIMCETPFFRAIRVSVEESRIPTGRVPERTGSLSFMPV
jgi:hypothetical protein